MIVSYLTLKWVPQKRTWGRKAMTEATRQPPLTRQLTSSEALRRLGSVPFGRVVFTLHALPAIRPVNHIVQAGRVIIRSHDGAAIVGTLRPDRGTVLAYEADDIDAVSRTGWTVVVTGLGRLVEDPAEAERYCDLLHPWLSGDMSHVIKIDPEIVTGFELLGGDLCPASRDMGPAP